MNLQFYLPHSYTKANKKFKKPNQTDKKIMEIFVAQIYRWSEIEFEIESISNIDRERMRKTDAIIIMTINIQYYFRTVRKKNIKVFFLSFFETNEKRISSSSLMWWHVMCIVAIQKEGHSFRFSFLFFSFFTISMISN